MLSEDKNKWCWSNNYGYVGEPQDTLQGAIDDYFECNPDKPGERPIKVGHPNFFNPEIDGNQIIDDIVYNCIDDEIIEWSDEYLSDVKKEHIDELSKELTTVFRKWEKKHGYENTGYVVLETKSYPVDSNGKLIVV
jgi:hypothetical protein